MKRYCAALLALVMLLGTLSVTAQADTQYGGDGWNVTFSGNQMISNFKSSDMDDAIYAMEPGDTVVFKVALDSVYSGSTSWYMENRVLKSLEDSRDVASGGAYSYILTYTDHENNTRMLYSSDEVGGEGVTAAGDEGLHQATSSLKEFFFLDDIEKNEPGFITLQVHLEGETQGNDYQNTLAELQMRFAVELNSETPTRPTFPEDDESKPTTPTFPTNPDSSKPTVPPIKEEKPTKPVYVSNPKTSDASLVLSFSAIMLVSGGGLMYLAILLKNKKEDEAE